MRSEPSKVVVADDSPTVLARVQGDLQARGHRVVATEDWVAANRLVHAERPDLVVLDQHLGAFQGTFLVRAFRAFFGPGLPLVVMSSEDVQGEALAAGATAFVLKARLEQLPDVVDTILACSERARCRSAPGGPICPCRHGTRRAPRPEPLR